jgi:hypothetical protein
LDKSNGSLEPEQTRQGLNRHWSGNNVAPDYDQVDVVGVNVADYGFQCGQIGMDIVESSEPHDEPSRPSRETITPAENHVIP